MFHKILIANRGEIARRVARTCRRMGIAIATVHSDADRDAPHVRDIGESVRLGRAPALDSYLHIDRVVQAALSVGADAVHPGYGFLSENPALADALQAAGISFIGPTAQTLRDFGDKAAAKRLAQAAGVPTIPGSPGASADAAEVASMAREVGLPVLLKAVAGGGGKGIRIVQRADELADAIAGAMREGTNAFGDPALLVERYLPHGRHVEVQILGDGRGGVWHLWERECSLQRRHQKVVEEAPALPLPAGLRQRLLDAALALGRHVRYRALGTVEFLVVGQDFHFLEVNPRLQVEHPVTEAVTGLDLVELQIRAAAGASLADALTAPRCEGHAIEVRLYAEDPAQDFMPSTGTLHRVQWPADGTRVETAVEAGSVITPHYDPMMAKLIVHGRDRDDALGRMRAALAATRVVGVAHNLAFLEALLRDPAVTQGAPDTSTIDRLPRAIETPRWLAAAPHIAAAWTLATSRRNDSAAPAALWASLTNWRLSAPGAAAPLQPQFEVQADGRWQGATVSGTGPRWQVRIGDAQHDVGFDAHAITLDAMSLPLVIGSEGPQVWIGDGRHTAQVAVRPALSAERRPDAAAGAALLAPLTGKVLDLRVSEGDAVLAGQVLLVIESMKMELRVCAPHDGIVRGLATAVGAGVERGAVLVTVQEHEALA